jgi:uncharacterized protein YkwD
MFLGVAAVGLAAPDWHALPPAEFTARPELGTRIDFDRFDPSLMSTAIFHETNRVRQQLGLRPFSHLPKLDAAADLKAAVGVVQDELVHENPLPMTATPAERVRAVGLHFRQVAENISRLGVFDLPSGVTQVGVRQRGGRTDYFHPETRQPVGLRTYGAFAQAVVQSWMNSPGHRANIVNPALVSLGCAVRTCYSPTSRHEQLYAVQVFFTPR